MSNPLPNILLAVDRPHACLGEAARVFDSKSGHWLATFLAGLRGEVIHLRRMPTGAVR